MTTVTQTPAAARAAAGVPGAAVDVPMTDAHQAQYHLRVLSWPGCLTEIRYRYPGQQMRRGGFFHNSDEAARYALNMSTRADVYAGVLPRATEGGGKDALRPCSRWMWVECDTPMAIERALRHPIPPPFVIRSSHGKAHAYWYLDNAVPLDLLERANRRLAWDLGGDMKACDAARILRVAGTRNHKYAVPERVSITRLEIMPAAIVSLLVGDLPDPAPPRPAPSPTGGRVRDARRAAQGPDPEKDAILAVPSRVYVERLAGREVYHNMATCPFHSGGQERTPSFHVAGPNDNLWMCFGCDEGGDVFTFAAKLWGMDERTDFPELKRRLVDARL